MKISLQSNFSYQVSQQRAQNINLFGTESNASARSIAIQKSIIDETKDLQGQSEKLDFSSMTPKQLRETVNDLIRNGKMTLDESSPLVLMMFRDISSNGQILPDVSDEPINVLATLQDGLDGAKSRNEKQSVHFIQTAIDALLRLQGNTKSIDMQA